MVLDPNIPPKRRAQARFKFLNSFMDVGDFLDMVRDNWNIEMDGRLMQRLWRKLKRLQPILRGMSRRLSRNTQKTQEYKGKLDLTQQKLDGDMFNLELIHKVKNLTDERSLITLRWRKKY